jgi:hypothetical protein
VYGFINYQQYGILGIDRLLQASPLFYLFHHSSTLDELQANIMIANLMVLAVCWLQYPVNGISLGANEINGLFDFYLVSTMMMVILTAISGWFGASKNWKKGAGKAAIFWIVFAFYGSFRVKRLFV